MSEQQSHKDVIEEVNETLTGTEQWIEKYIKPISITAVAVIVAVTGFFAYRHFVLAPKEVQAQSQLFKGEFYFQADSFRVALDGNGGDYEGLLAIIDQYGSTDAGNLAKAYAGLSYKSLGEYDKAISLLSEFGANDQLVSPAIIGAVGDCYVELGKATEAVDFFIQAAAAGSNDLISPVYLKKAGIAYESLGQYSEAVAVYTQIKEEYPSSMEAADIVKYIERAKLGK